MIPLFEIFPSLLLSSVLKCEKVMMCLLEKMDVSDKLYLGIGYSTVDCEFNVNESTVYI